MQLDHASSTTAVAAPQPAPSPSPAADPRLAGIAHLLTTHAAGNVLLQLDGRVVYLGGMAGSLLSVDAGQAVSLTFFELLPPQFQAAAVTRFNAALTGVTEPAFGVEFARSTGNLGVAVQFTPLVENNAVIAVMANLTELGSRQAVNAALRGKFDDSKRLATSAVLTVFHLDARGLCTFMGNGWTAHTGQSVADALGMGWMAVVAEDHRQNFRSAAGAAHQERRGFRVQTSLRSAAGHFEDAELGAAPVVDVSGRIVAYVGLIAFASPSRPVVSPPESEMPLVSGAPDASPTVLAQPATEPASQPPVTALPSAAMPTASMPTAVPPTPAMSTAMPAAGMPTEPLSPPDSEALSESAPTPTSTPATPTIAPTYGVSADVIAQAPLAPAPRFGLATVDQAGPWTPPAIQEGYTDAALLIPEKKDVADQRSSEVVEPGVDKVTGLANRLLFAQHVQSTVARMQADALTVSVAFIDLHGLGVQRSAVGSRIANDYLFLLSKRLEATIRSIEISGRIDGDVLGVLSINWLFAEDLPVVAKRLMTKLAEPLAGREGMEISVAMSLGMAVARPEEDVNDLFGRAWGALQVAKSRPGLEFEIDFGR